MVPFLSRIAVAATLLLVSSHSVFAHTQGMHISNVYARATFPMAATGAVYLSLMNHHNEAVTLVAIDVDSSVAQEAQIHTTVMDGDVMRMREVAEGVKIGPHGTALFAPGGMHVMLMGLTKGLNDGESFELTLTFDNHDPVTITVPVKKDNQGSTHHHH